MRPLRKSQWKTYLDWAVDAFRLRIPHDMWAEPPLFAGRPRTHVEAVYVRVATDKGVTGWGECNGFSGAIQKFSQRFVGEGCEVASGIL